MAPKELYLAISVGLISGFFQGYLAPQVSAQMNKVFALTRSLLPPILSSITFSKSKRSSDGLSIIFIAAASIDLSLWAVGQTGIEVPINATMSILSFILTIYPFLSSGANSRLHTIAYTTQVHTDKL
jgi:hypothetical protein